MIWSRLSASCAEANNINADMLEALTPDEEADDGDIW